MEIIKDNDIINVKNFLSGSEQGVFSYEHNKKELSSINIRDMYQESSPIAAVANSAQNKLQKVLEHSFVNSELKVSNAFDVVYDATRCSDDEIDFGNQDYVAILPISRSVQVKTLHENLMVDALGLLIAPRDGLSILRDRNDAVSLISIAHISID